MTRFTKVASILALSMLVLILPAVASAQWNGNNRNDDDYYRNGRNNRNDDDYYRNGSYNRNMRGTIQNLKNRARNFERRLDKIDDRNDDRYGNNGGWGNNNNRRMDDLQRLADRFVKATDDLANEYGNGRDLRGSRDEARRVLDIGSQIENRLYNSRSNRQASNEWDKISYDLRALAQAYGLNYSNRGNNGSWRDKVPFPLPY